MQRPKTDVRRPAPALADRETVIQTKARCYAIAEQCEALAATVEGQQARQILLEVAVQWRRVGAGLTARRTARPLRALH